MDRNHHKLCWRIGFFLAGIFMLSLSFSIPGTAMAAGKPDVIHVALIGDYSGPYVPTVGPTRSGAEDAWQYINEKLGGVRGVKVKPVIRDMSGKVALGLSMYNEVINMKPKPAFIDIYITPLSEALRERYVEDDVVGFHAAAVVSLYPQANSYGLYPLYPEQLAVAVKWVRDNWKEKRNPRVGIITWDTAYGRAILTDEFFAYLKKIGVDFVGTPQLFGIRDINVTTQLMNLRAERPDYLMANNAAGGALAIHKGLREMGWNIPLLNTGGEDWGTVRLDPPSFDGDIISMHVKSFDETDDPSIKTIMKFFNQNKRTINDRTLFYLIPWYNALLQHKIMTEVVDKYGWKGLNTVNIKKALNNVKDFAPLKGLTRISYSEKQRTPSVIRLYRVTGGKFLPLTGFLKVPDMRPAEYR